MFQSSKLALLLLLALFLLSGCGVQKSYKLVWSDEFNSKPIKASNWQHEVYPGVVSTAQQVQYYTDRRENSFIKNGRLIIQADKEKYDISNYTSARLNSYGKFDFLYGKVEARIKMPKGQGIQSKLWLLPVDLNYGVWAASGQIDVVGVNGQNPKEIAGGIYFGSHGHGSDHIAKSFSDQRTDFSRDFHVYTLEWQPYEMRWYVDEKLYAIQNDWSTTGGLYPAPFDKPFYLGMNISIAREVDENISWPQQMAVDWIRVYETVGNNKPPQVKITSPADKAILSGDVIVEVDASDPEGKLKKVQFYKNDELIGESTRPPYSFNWPAIDGCYKIRARAIDTQDYVGADGISIEYGIGCPPEPFSGVPAQIPGKIEAEDFDKSVKGESYYDTDTGNAGGAYRRDVSVDIQDCEEGGFDIGWMITDEWLQYTVNVAKSGTYDIICRVATPQDGAKIHIEFDGENKTGTMAIPNTGDWQKYTDLVAKNVELKAGKQVMKLFVEYEGLNLNYIEIKPASE
ncbi:MAG: family 16 glycosylhydrolase [Planctomycetes bacterium]|nr:family 16 glycosylhydrolase [Planctomycetota bacterium]